MRYNTIRLVCFLLLLVFLPSSHATAGVYVTLEGFEVDKMASIWLIQRFIDQEAKFKFVAKGDKLPAGERFDMPESSLRRTATQSTYEVLLSHYTIKDKLLRYIGKIIHDIEINTWERKRLAQTHEVQLMIGSIIQDADNNEKKIERSTSYFDRLYNSLL